MRIKPKAVMKIILPFFVTDGFTTDDVIYQWKLNDSVQFAKSLFLPGGFELSDYIGKSKF